MIRAQRRPRDHPEAGRAYSRLRSELLAAVAEGETACADPDMLTSALYGVGGARPRRRRPRAALRDAVAAVNLVIDGFARRPDARTTPLTRKEPG